MCRLLASILLCVLTLPLFAVNSKIPLIIDTDMVIDDWIAILLLTEIPSVDMKAITVTGAGEATCEHGVINALKLLEFTQKNHVPVTCGRGERLEGGNLFPAAWRVQMDNLLGFELPSSPIAPSTENAVELMHAIIHKSKEPVTILTLGPVTNIADLLSKYPADRKKIEIISMAGVFYAGGNVFDSTHTIANHTSEWNAFGDALALKQVVKSGVKITFIGLDVTRSVPVTSEFIERFKESDLDKAGKFVEKLLDHDKEFVSLEGFYFWDPLAAAAVFAPEIFDYKTLRVQVLTNPIEVRGQTKIMPYGTQVRVASEVDSTQFEKLFIDAFEDKAIKQAQAF